MVDEQERDENIQAICSEAQKGVLDAIPEKWRIHVQRWKKNKDARGVPEACGVLTPRQLDITSQDATSLLPKLHAGELTAVEVTEAFCARAAVAHQMVNCLTAFFPDEALEVARQLDEASKKPVAPLHGLPICVKDMHDLIGKRTTFGYVSWYSNISKQDASVVKVMKDAGAVIFGKTTMPQTGMALETWSNLWGRTCNPYNANLGSGGSSGGDGVLVAMRGVPCAPLTSDIGGSIRAPAAFNGLYGMRPTSDRVPKFGVQSTAPGQLSIKVSVGPNCHSLADLKLLVKLILTHPTLPYEPTCIPGSWVDIKTADKKLKIGVLSSDGVVDPHPPIQRALKETAEKLRAAGHDVFEFTMPFDLWEVAEVTWALYFQTGAAEIKAAIAKSGESTIPTFLHNLKVFKTRELSTPELFKLNTRQQGFKIAMSEAWTAAGMDVMMCPCAPAAGFPHNFPAWWGYTTLFNLLDLPSIIIPVKDFEIDPVKDAKDSEYKPRSNPFDAENWRLCKWRSVKEFEFY